MALTRKLDGVALFVDRSELVDAYFLDRQRRGDFIYVLGLAAVLYTPSYKPTAEAQDMKQ